MPLAPRLMTAAAAAAELGVHPETIRRAIRSGRLACYRFGNAVRIAPDHLAAFMEAHLCHARAPTVQNPAMEDAAETLRLQRRFRQAFERQPGVYRGDNA